MQNYSNKDFREINECTSRGSCSISPTISSLEKLSFAFLQQLAYYLLQLEILGASNNKIKYEIINVLASLVTVNEFSENQLYSTIRNEYFMLLEARKTYISLSKKQGLKPKLLKDFCEFSQNTTVSQAISKGEKLFLNKYKTQSSQINNLTEVLNIILKSVCLNLIKLKDFSDFNADTYHEILETLNIYNNKKFEIDLISEKIYKLAQCDKNLQIEISNLMLNSFDGISEVTVSHSTRKGKAILVSGNNFFDLLKILQQTKDKDIDVYTHSNLLITHALNRFQEFPHLKGHYGDTTENCILDFATFPGAILLTQNSHSNNEYLYRGRLFSKDYIVPNGVIKVENDDYTPVIEASINAKGFSRGKIKNDSIVGYDIEKVKKKFRLITDKLNNNKIEKLYIVGLDAHSEIQRLYFKEFYENLKRNEYVLSFSYSANKDNILTINVGNYLPLATNLLKLFFTNFSISSKNIVFMFTTCDVMSISSVVEIKRLGAQNIFMVQCQPTLINPSVFETFSKNYGIKSLTSSVSEDLKLIRNI